MQDALNVMLILLCRPIVRTILQANSQELKLTISLIYILLLPPFNLSIFFSFQLSFMKARSYHYRAFKYYSYPNWPVTTKFMKFISNIWKIVNLKTHWKGKLVVHNIMYHIIFIMIILLNIVQIILISLFPYKYFDLLQANINTETFNTVSCYR